MNGVISKIYASCVRTFYVFRLGVSNGQNFAGARESARPPSAGPLAGPDREGRPVWEVGQYNLAIYHSFT